MAANSKQYEATLNNLDISICTKHVTKSGYALIRIM